MKDNKILWEEFFYPKIHLIKGLIISVLPISILIVGIIYLSIFVIILSVLFLICPLLYISGPKAFFFIRFTDSHLCIKRRYLGRTKRFELSELFKIEIIITKRSERYWSEPMLWSAKLKFIMRITSVSGEKVYSFYRLFNERKTTRIGKSDPIAKQKAIQKRKDFEQKIRGLEITFKNLITIKDEAPPQKTFTLGSIIASSCFIGLTIAAIVLLPFVSKESNASIIIGIVVYSVMIVICIILNIYQFIKHKKKRKEFF